MSLEMTPQKPPGREKKVLLQDLNALLTCTLCNGYFIDAMTFDSCLHTFCRSCVLNHFETTKQQTCPKCEKKKASFKPDHQLQALVYKMVPGLFGKETQRREDFYRSSVRASSTCSEDSVLGDMQKDQDKWISQREGTSGQDNFFSPEDPISLSLEFYQSHLDDTETQEPSRKLNLVSKRTLSSSIVKSEDLDDKKIKTDRRYLQCPAAVSMSHLQKFLRMKYALSSEHRVDIIYEGEVLPYNYTLMDVAYTYNWTKLKPMRFFYRIFTPLKVQPIKIINTATSNGSKHLQIVPVRPATASDLEAEKSKEQFVAQLKLQSKHKPLPTTALGNLGTKAGTAENCIFEYEEQDEEIKRFAESRDREWARMRHEDVDGATAPVEPPVPPITVPVSIPVPVPVPGVPGVPGVESSGHHVKKRKKSKHSKGDAKKPKLHAEITSAVQVQQESIKLKVKLTPAHQHNGHKHKHRSPPVVTPATTPATSSTAVQVQTPLVNKPQAHQVQPEMKKPEPVRKLNDICIKKADQKPMEPPKKVPKVEAPKMQKLSSKGSTPTPNRPNTVDAAKSGAVIKLEERRRGEEQKSFLKTFQSNANTRQQPGEKVQPVASPKTDAKKPMITYSNHTKQNFEKKIASLQQQALHKQMKSHPPQKMDSGHKEKKVSFSEKPHILNSHQYPSGFTVSKVESGARRKSESEGPGGEKRPCLEITLINASGQKPPASPAPHRDSVKAKRPPPATIPLDRIKKSNLKQTSGKAEAALDLSKKVEPLKNGITTLNGLKFPSSVSSPTTPTTPSPITSTLTANLQMLSKVALQHSKQQQQQHQQNTNQHSSNNKVRPQIPNLQTLRIPHVTTSVTTPTPSQSRQSQSAGTGSGTPGRNMPNLANLPKLNEISKSNLKMLSNLNNNLKPIVQRTNTQSMIRSIPNPAMLVRQHNQSRMNLTNGQNQNQKQNQSQDQHQNQDKTSPPNLNQTQPKILNPLAKENTNSGTTTTTTSISSKDSGKSTTNTIHSLMNKMLDQSKGQMMVTASSTAAT